jgi:hypothetical protein
MADSNRARRDFDGVEPGPHRHVSGPPEVLSHRLISDSSMAGRSCSGIGRTSAKARGPGGRRAGWRKSRSAPVYRGGGPLPVNSVRQALQVGDNLPGTKLVAEATRREHGAVENGRMRCRGGDFAVVLDQCLRGWRGDKPRSSRRMVRIRSSSCDLPG